MTDHDALLAAIAAHPAEDTPRGALRDYLEEAGRWDYATVLGFVLDRPGCDGRRLLAADWFESQAGRVACPGACRGYRYPGKVPDDTHLRNPTWLDCPECRGAGTVPDGQADRAEFVRVQVELAGLAADTSVLGMGNIPRMNTLQRRERELLAATPAARDLTHRFYWFDPADRWPGVNHEFRRGFVEAVTLAAADWLRCADAILAEHPVATVTLTTAPEVEIRDVPPVRARARFAGEEWWVSANIGVTEERAARLLLEFRWPRVTTWHLPPVGQVQNYVLRHPLGGYPAGAVLPAFAVGNLPRIPPPNPTS